MNSIFNGQFYRMGQLCPFVSFCAVLLSIKQKSKVSIQYNKITLVKKDYD